MKESILEIEDPEMKNVRIEQLPSGAAIPVVIRSDRPDAPLGEWVGSSKQFVDMILAKQGAILFRGFRSQSTEEFQDLIASLTDRLVEYKFRSTPRTKVSGRIYTSTEYPADEWIPMHNEMAYTNAWPMKVWFYCAVAAEKGGETPIADSRVVFRAIDSAVREEFSRKGVMYARNYSPALDLPWQEVFQTTDRKEVEAYCKSNGIAFEWLEGDRLRTRQVCQAVAKHPRSGEDLWFNQAHLFHVTSLRPEVRDFLLSEFAEQDLPRNTFYGDGSAIPQDVLDHIRQVFEQTLVLFPWEVGDMMMLDNMLVAHGRAPYEGARKIMVGMAEEVHSKDLQVLPVSPVAA
ncbi:MAG: TauD/TfdA family dioxygenase [Acidobacteria bacterium]|nr:TauD/TfdA family dioxygenase [Acidobacteriota bacterium]